MSDSESSQSNYAYHVGRKVGKYTLDSLIGRGGMAEVYKAIHPELGHAVAIKILHPFHTDIGGFVERFRQEARAIVTLRHPHIVQLFDFDATEDGLYYMVMEYIDGLPLDVYLQQHSGPLPLPQAGALLRQVAEALHAAHQKGIIHRDVKPSNILIDSSGQAFLADFGIAQMMGAERLTMSYMSPGTPSFMAPEQGTGQAITPAVDVYALGGLLYQMVTKRLPYEDENPVALIMRKSTQPPLPPRLHNPTLPPAVDEVVLRAMSLNPRERFADVMSMVQALEKAMGMETAVPPHPTPASAQDTAAIPDWMMHKPQIKHYAIQELIGESVHCQRFLARNETLQQPAILDIFRVPANDAPDLAAQFQQHWQGLAQLNHPNIAAVSNVDVTLDNRPFAAYAHVPGATLAAQLDAWRHQPVQTLALVRAIAEALAAAGAAGLVHHDLRPQHIFLRDDATPVLVGLGGPLTNTAVPPSDHLDYAAPEQGHGLPVSVRSNIYSLGVLLYELLAGERPPVVPEGGAAPLSLESARPGLAEQTYALAAGCLWVDPARRYEGWAEFLAALDTAVRAEKGEPEPEQAKPLHDKHPRWQAAVAALAVVVVLIGSVWAWRATHPTEAAATPEAVVVSETAVTPTIDVILTPSASADAELTVLGPSPYREIAPDEMVEFRWSWPHALAAGQQFVVYLTGEYGRFPVGVVTQSSGTVQYELAVPASDLARDTGEVRWQVVLETAVSGDMITASDLYMLNLAGGGTAVTPTVGAAASSSGITISHVTYNPPGDDLPGEFVRINNTGNEAVDLTGWLLQDEATSPHVYRFPTFVLGAGTAVQVWTGSGHDDDANLYWGAGSPVWNNGGDTATLLTNAGLIAAQCEYSGGDESFECP